MFCFVTTLRGGVQNRQTSTAVANIMAAMAKALPSYAWLTALPQLISRICHTNPEVNTVTNHIITHVAEAYPQQVCYAPCTTNTSSSLPWQVLNWYSFIRCHTHFGFVLCPIRCLCAAASALVDCI